jgi:2-oxoisovalerate dehydrogenase E2 component (dihydrolipoyl transacylase)
MQKSQGQAKEIKLPKLAESVVSATIGKWLKKPGDRVEEYEPLCEIVTEKVTAEIPSTEEGIVSQILVPEGATVDVGTVICVIEVRGAAGAAGSPEAAGSAGSAAAYRDTGNTAGVQDGIGAGADQSMRHRHSPAVRSLADEHNIDLKNVKGSGLGGRITRKDVLRYIDGDESARMPVRTTGLHLTQEPKVPKMVPEEVEVTGRGETLIDVTPIRNTIASRMRQSVSEIPHAWMMIEVDVTNLVYLRNKLKDEFQKREGINLTYLAFVLKAVVNAIKDYPIMNSVWAVDKIIVKRDINISLAVGTEDSVLTPVIHKADHMNIPGLAKAIDELARRTRAGKLRPEDMQGGTFTVNNTGSFGSVLSYPIINYPQAAILTFESIVKKPVVIDDMIAVRSMANMCLSLDHRILDGVICGRFLQRVKENIEGYSKDTKIF